jgi:hypothetical protein
VLSALEPSQQTILSFWNHHSNLIITANNSLIFVQSQQTIPGFWNHHNKPYPDFRTITANHSLILEPSQQIISCFGTIIANHSLLRNHHSKPFPALEPS